SIRSVNYAPLVKAADRLSWEKENVIIIKQLNRDNQIVTRDNATEYFPLRYISPWRIDSYNGVGYDVYSQADRQRAIDIARKSKNISITNSVPPDRDVDGLVIGVYDTMYTFGMIMKQFQDVGLAIKIIDRGYNSSIYDSSQPGEKYQDDFVVERSSVLAD
ncbi:9962_t:CDS:2, partial [Racocetra fulgida]